MRWIAYFSLAFGLALPALTPVVAHAQAAAGEPAIVKRAAELREQPGEASRSLGSLAAQTPITRTAERNGAWVGVRTAQGQSGWLHIFDVAAANSPSQGGNAATNTFRGVTSFFNRGSGSGSGATTSTSTVGIRGLGAEDIANSQPNLNAVTQAEQMRLDAQQAQQFATMASLAPRTLVDLPAPAPPRAPAGGPRGQGGSPGQPGMMP